MFPRKKLRCTFLSRQGKELFASRASFFYPGKLAGKNLGNLARATCEIPCYTWFSSSNKYKTSSTRKQVCNTYSLPLPIR